MCAQARSAVLYQTAFCVFQANTTRDKKGITIYVVELLADILF